jgi:hypothetical protein
MIAGRKNLSYPHKSCSDPLQHDDGEPTSVAIVKGVNIQKNSSNKKSAPLMENRLGAVKVKAWPELHVPLNNMCTEIGFKTIPNGKYCGLRMHHA